MQGHAMLIPDHETAVDFLNGEAANGMWIGVTPSNSPQRRRRRRAPATAIELVPRLPDRNLNSRSVLPAQIRAT
jgi:hypothetical protein